jgi:hypothetical protein
MEPPRKAYEKIPLLTSANLRDYRMTKRPEEIALMAESGRLLAQVFGHLIG